MIVTKKGKKLKQNKRIKLKLDILTQKRLLD